MSDYNEKEARGLILSAIQDYFENIKLPELSRVYQSGDKIKYASRVYDAHEMMSATDAILDFWLTANKYADLLEQDLASFIGVKYSLLVNSGSSANLLAFSALTDPSLDSRQIKRGDEVITVACGFPTTISPIIQYGAIPVFVDVTLPEYNINVDRLEEAYSSKTKAVMLAHTLGNPFNIKTVKDFCDTHGLWLIEDNCDALGSIYTLNGATQKTGSFGDIGTSSFYPAHHMTTGEGGAVYTNNAQLYKILKSLRDWGRDCICPGGVDNFCKHRYDGQYGELPQGYDHKYVYSRFGYNLKITDLQAAIGYEQLKKVPTFTKDRQDRFKWYTEALQPLTDYLILPSPTKNSSPSWFGYPITIKSDNITRNQLVKYLEDNNIQTRLLFAGNIIRHPCFDYIRNSDAYRVVGELTNSDTVTENTFWLGTYPGISSDMIDFIAKTIKSCIYN